MKFGSRYQQRRDFNHDELLAQRMVIGPGLGLLQHVNATHEELSAQRALIGKGKPVIGNRGAWKTALNYIVCVLLLVITGCMAIH